MPLSPEMTTLMVLAAKTHELDELANALTHRLTGNAQSDAVIQLQLRDIFAERVAIAARRTAIVGGGAFTPPSDTDVQNLQQAITDTHKAIVASANATVLLGLGTALLAAYGSAASGPKIPSA